MTTTFIDKQKNSLIKKFHALLGNVNMDEEAKRAFLSSHGVASSKDLNVYELTEACGKLDLLVNPELMKLDKARKQLMGVPCTGAKIKAIACRAAQRDGFNDIPMEQLRSLYAAFNNKQKDLKRVGVMTEEMITYLSALN